jgi:ABC-type transport system substrate-binding protein
MSLNSVPERGAKLSQNYWARTLDTRLPRRRALAATSAGALSAAFLAACGGSDNKGASKGPIDTSGLLYTPVDTTKSAVKGGIWANTIGNPTDGFTPYIGGNSISLNHVNHMYQRLLSYKNGENAQDADGTLEGDAAASWEVSPDHLQITFKLRQNNKYDPRPPTNSRVLTSEDVKYSWEKLTGPGATSPNGKDLANNLNPDAVITSVTYPDANTVVMKLKEPAKPILGMIAYPWYLNIMPVESADKFDVRSEARGTGPFMLTKAEFGQRFEYRRNPNYWKGDRPFLEGIDYTIIPQTPTVLSQFKAKHIWGPYLPSPDAVLATKKDSPELLMRAVSPFQGQTGKNDIVPSKLAGSVFADIRLRRAISMLLDRDAYIATFGNVDVFQREGIPIETGWQDFVPVAWKASGEWQDPKEGKALGPELAKYYQLNPDEAGKLIRAAGKYLWRRSTPTPARRRLAPTSIRASSRSSSKCCRPAATSSSPKSILPTTPPASTASTTSVTASTKACRRNRSAPGRSSARESSPSTCPAVATITCTSPWPRRTSWPLPTAESSTARRSSTWRTNGIRR